MRAPLAEGQRVVPGFLLPFGRRHSLLGSSCARWGIPPSSRPAYRQPAAAGPHRGYHVPHGGDAAGVGAAWTPGTVARTRPADGVRSAPAASQRPVPVHPLLQPACGSPL